MKKRIKKKTLIKLSKILLIQLKIQKMKTQTTLLILLVKKAAQNIFLN